MDTKTSSDKTAKVKTRVSAYALRLPTSIKADAEKLAREGGTSLSQFVVTAVAEKISALRTASYLELFKRRANLSAFDKLMRRMGGAPPRADDVLTTD